ncbi:hypothetical protein [Mucilaginibacter arboris]|uniref:Uncharacterized protein n=1 Tax=Mucilaginibacter arboris TaxID=2682090 RepID=A0A7K1T1J4_9SPHI|nr:hypothetical protein [Mucilaginibacter arboris]MVN23453.1 hypothetical protein [Mucilaginibacter arboris]
MNSKVALIFVFNHKYDKNIDVLENLYKNRFSNIYHLVPFYEGDKQNVIPVYESSQHFQGYLAQGYKKYFKEEYEHYFFIGDDLVLNPAINENNYKQYFHLSENASYIPEIHTLHHLTNNDTLRFLPVKSITGKKRWHWCKIKELVENYKHKAYAVENANEMPSYKEAEAILKNHGYEIQALTYRDLHGDVFPLTSATLKYAANLKSYFKKFPLAYPVVGSYSDIVIVSKSSIKKFCHYCGVFATNKLFVEFAIPTALLLASEKVVTEKEIGKRGSIYWLYTQPELEKYNEDMRPYNLSLKDLMQKFPEDKLYIHPIKLSKWKTETI